MTALHITHSTIFVNDIQLHAYHGVMPQEQLTGNDYLVGVSAQYPMKQFADISAVRVRVTKLNPPMGAQCAGAGVEIEMAR